MKQWKTIIFLIYNILILLSFISCQETRYQKDSKNKISKRAKKADDFIARQAIEITQNNIQDRALEDEKSLKKLKKEQKKQKATRRKIKRNTESPKFTGHFKFY